ncbi:4-galactosyl-N-acetylglucosaminide 3-alpha-L-fucosyltransferase FUT6-like [Ciona intestinalis]
MKTEHPCYNGYCCPAMRGHKASFNQNFSITTLFLKFKSNQMKKTNKRYMKHPILSSVVLIAFFCVIQVLRINQKIVKNDSRLSAVSRKQDFTICLYGVKQHIVINFVQDYDPNICGVCTLKTVSSYCDVIIFDFRHAPKIKPGSLQRQSPDQLFGWTSGDSAYGHRNMHKYDASKHEGIFNFTVWYKLDSDIPIPYGTLARTYRALAAEDRNLEEILAKKDKLAIWIVSNCDNSEFAMKRMEFGLAMKNTKIGKRLDYRGRCFDQERVKWQGYVFDPTSSLRDNGTERFKFYFAFENSYHCRYYITEKFWKNAFLASAVPVVWGPSKKDVEAVAPKHSFIHAEDFQSPEDLADYLLYLDKNDAEYREYFKWRTREDKWKRESGYPEDRPESFGMCKLCLMLHENLKNPKKRYITNLTEVVYHKDDECLKY